MTEEELKVSVCVVTYNHEKYIRQCLQSIVDQETDFEFEVIVGDDCSTDNTRTIVEEFVCKYPDRVRAVYQKENTRCTRNYLDVHAAARGRYIAHMDGDDYALPGKLQKQVMFLDQNPSCSMVCHRVQVLSEDGTKVLGIKPEGRQPVYTNIEGLIRRYLFFTHSSKMYRRSANVFDHSGSRDLIDFFVHIEHASRGQIGFISEILGCYRKHPEGATSAIGERRYAYMDMTVAAFDRARELGVDKEIVDYGKARYLLAAAVLCLTRGDLEGYYRCLNSSRINGGYISFSHAAIFRMQKRVYLLRVIFQVRNRARRLINKWTGKVSIKYA